MSTKFFTNSEENTLISKFEGVFIDIGKYTNLPTDLDKLQKKKLPLNIALSEIEKIAKQYNIDLSNAQKGKINKIEKPVLIISESFE